MKKQLFLTVILGLILLGCNPGTEKAGVAVPEENKGTYLDHTLPPGERIADLLDRLTPEEKIAQLRYDAPAIPRLNIPAYMWWGEALHGVARWGRATVFPQPVGMAATFDSALIGEVASAIGDEARVKYREALRTGNIARYASLTFWSPNINIFRDPRWGRGMETWGEDPFLTGTLGSAFVRGLQGNDPYYYKAVACAKHYGVHSGPEGLRHVFNARPPEKDFYETYLPAFEKLVKEAKVGGVMCAYNRTYDEPCCGSSFLLQDILRHQFGFKGYIVSDCWAINDFHLNHKVTANAVESAVKALKSGVNVNCGTAFRSLKEAFRQGLISEAEIDSSLAVLLRIRFRLGLFDPPGVNPYDAIPGDVLHSDEHIALARKTAQKSIVLLKNDGVLPLRKDIHSLYILGPMAADVDALLGNYNGLSDRLETVVEGITAKVSPSTRLEYRHAFQLDRENANPVDWASAGAKSFDATVVVMGINSMLEGEEGESIASAFKSDRKDIRLPQNQVEYLEKVCRDNPKPVIVVLTGGSPMAVKEVTELADAVIMAWYPGEQGGNAVADVIFGDVNPSGKLPVTFPESVDQLPPYDDYSMEGRTYKYMTAEPLFPFGFGLSYTTFTYENLSLSASVLKSGESLTATVDVVNTGDVAGDEVVQFYLSCKDADFRVPLFDLKGFRRVHLKPGERKSVSVTWNPHDLMNIDMQGNKVLVKGKYMVYAGGALPTERSLALGASPFQQAEFTVSDE
ncbi:MAG: glycoside hydrolase family 3 protein [Chlorobi bacterium]|nr:glycoside hydrolase family 3 protein [Chlorobiota bacterium]